MCISEFNFQLSGGAQKRLASIRQEKTFSRAEQGMNQTTKMRRYENDETAKDETTGTYKRDRLGVCELDRTCARRCRNRLECNRYTNNRNRRSCPSRCAQFPRQHDGPGRRVR